MLGRILLLLFMTLTSIVLVLSETRYVSFQMDMIDKAAYQLPDLSSTAMSRMLSLSCKHLPVCRK